MVNIYKLTQPIASQLVFQHIDDLNINKKPGTEVPSFFIFVCPKGGGKN